MRAAVVAGLAIGAGLGMAAGAFPAGVVQDTLWALSSTGFVVGAALLAVWAGREGHDSAAAGFVILVAAEAAMLSGTAVPGQGSLPAFAAGTLLYAPGLLLIGAARAFPMWSRCAGGLAALVFAANGLLTFAGSPQPEAGPLAGTGYLLLTVALVGWAWRLCRPARATSRTAASA